VTAISLRRRAPLNRVPEVTAFFWIIKILATTVGETAADMTATHFGLSVGQTALAMSIPLMAALALQFSRRRYVALPYWTGIVLISIVGTLITDTLSDGYGVSLWITTSLFSFALMVTFCAWFLRERTLSIHTVITGRRETFYWVTVLFTFALGTAGGDLLAEQVGLGYLPSALLFAAAIAIVYGAHRRAGLGAVAAFWAAYVLTRPLGASIGDFLSQPRHLGGLGVGTVTTSTLFLGSILALVTYLAVTRIDQTERAALDMVDAEACPSCALRLAPAAAICADCGWLAEAA
jgi:uncharacterized membrane-anchored protein